MYRRTFLCGLGTFFASPLVAARMQDNFDAAATVLERAVRDGQVDAATLFVRNQGNVFTRSYGAAKSEDDVYLLASISKPMSAAAVMTLYDRGQFDLDDPAAKFLPEFTGEGREQITIRQLLTHVSGLPDQLPENETLRKRHASLAEFVEHALRTPLLFEPGSRYRYSSMGILLAAEIAQRISGTPFHELMDRGVFQPLEMRRSALGLGRFALEETIRCQTEDAAPEAGAGDTSAKDWDWNSPFWRNLGSPWGGVHASAADVGRFLAEFLHPEGKVVRAETARLMIQNHNRAGLRPRGLGFELGARAGGVGCSERTFGHGGATGTLAWADPATDTICVVLTTLPATAARPHPRNVASDLVAAAVR